MIKSSAAEMFVGYVKNRVIDLYKNDNFYS